jgi:hypothetical protein
MRAFMRSPDPPSLNLLRFRSNAALAPSFLRENLTIRETLRESLTIREIFARGSPLGGLRRDSPRMASRAPPSCGLIGVCVRRVSLRARPDWIRIFHNRDDALWRREDVGDVLAVQRLAQECSRQLRPRSSDRPGIWRHLIRTAGGHREYGRRRRSCPSEDRPAVRRRR